MNKYLIKLFVDNDLEHFAGRGLTRELINKAGINFSRAKWSSGAYSKDASFHSWVVECTDEELTVLVLLGAIVEANLTEVATKTSKEKLDKMIDAIKQHMSTFSTDELAIMNSKFSLSERVNTITCFREDSMLKLTV